MSTPSNNHDETTAEIDSETEAGFLEDVSPADHPSTLRITARRAGRPGKTTVCALRTDRDIARDFDAGAERRHRGRVIIDSV